MATRKRKSEPHAPNAVPPAETGAAGSVHPIPATPTAPHDDWEGVHDAPGWSAWTPGVHIPKQCPMELSTPFYADYLRIRCDTCSIWQVVGKNHVRVGSISGWRMAEIAGKSGQSIVGDAVFDQPVPIGAELRVMYWNLKELPKAEK